MNRYRSAKGERAVRQRHRELLTRWPVPNRRVTVPTRHGETFVMVSGPESAPPVLLLHGSAATAAMWLADAAAFSEHVRVHAVDLIGEPGLSSPARPPLGSPAYADWLDDVLAGLGLDRVGLAGVSLGGWLAIDYAARRPERVERLALLNPSGLGRAKRGFLGKAMVLAMLGDRGRRLTLAIAAAPTPVTGELAEFALLVAKHFRPRMERIPLFGEEALRALPMPVLLIIGARDALLDAAGSARRVAAVLPAATVRVLPGAGHILADQGPTVLDFLLAREVPR